MNPALEHLARKLTAYLSHHWGEAVSVTGVEQIPGGASRETYRLRLHRDAVTDEDRDNGGGRPADFGLILRRDPASSLIDTERSLEFRTYQAVHAAGFPVPEPVLLEEDPQHLERPFSLMAEVNGCESATTNFALTPWLERRQGIGERKWSLLGELTRLEIDDLGLEDFMATPAHAAARELAYWAGVIRADALHPQPVAEATIRWLERHLPPPSPRLCLVHGDFRSGNFLYDDQGNIPAVLDWEMAHIGDPLEDLAWSLDPLWAWPDQQLAGGLLPRREAMHLWQAASGLEVDPATFRWWQVFASLKGLAIWISSTEDFANGASKAPILALAGWLMTDRHNRILVDRLNPASPHQYAEALL